MTQQLPKSNDLQSLHDKYGSFLNVQDLCKILKVSRFVIDRMLKKGELPAAKLGGQYRVRTDDLIKWWDEQLKQEQRNLLKDCLR